MTIWISRELSLFNFERHDISWASIIHPSQKLRPFDFVDSSRVQFRSSRQIIGLNRTSESNVMIVWICLALPCFISSVSILYELELDIQEETYDHLNSSRASVVEFRKSPYNMGLNWTSETKVMAVWICEELSCSISIILIYYWPESDIQVKSNGHLNLPSASIFNFERVDILCAWIGRPSEKLWPFEFLQSFHCSISSVSIYQGPQSYTWVKSYGCLTL